MTIEGDTTLKKQYRSGMPEIGNMIALKWLITFEWYISVDLRFSVDIEEAFTSSSFPNPEVIAKTPR